MAELDVDDPEHPDAWVGHESGWTLNAYQSGLLIWQNPAEGGEPRHLRGVDRDQILEIWKGLSREEIAVIDAEPWLPGYGCKS